MKFSCPQCDARYNIADEKLPAARALRMNCKKCGHLIRVRRDGPEAAEPAPAQSPAMPAPGSAADFGDSTRVASIEEIKRMQADAAASTPEPAAAPAPVAAAAPAAPARSVAITPGRVWYVLINGDQQGPLDHGEVMAKLGRGDIDQRTYLWKDGMGDWQRLGLIAEFEPPGEGAAAAPGQIPELAGPDAAQATVAMDATQLHAELAKVRGEAAAAPVASEVPQATVAMDATQLHAELAKVRGEQPAAAAVELEAEIPQATVAMNATQLHAELAKVRGEQPQFAVDMEPEDPAMAAEAADASTMATLMGMPTGDEMKREDSDVRRATAEEVADMIGDIPQETVVSTSPLPKISDEAEQQAAAAGIRGPVANASDDYLTAAPGEATKVFMATAGIFKRRKQQRVAAIVATIVISVLGGIIGLDVAGIWTIPGMGLVYDMTGYQDPNKDRARERTESKLSRTDISPEERKRLRAKLMGLGQGGKRQGGPKPAKGKVVQGIEDKKTLTVKERDIAADIFGDTRKQEGKIQLTAPDKIRTPNLPKGLKQEAIVEVITESIGSMKLCYAEAARAGERIANGKMEIEFTILGTGRVEGAKILTSKYRTTTMGKCAVKRITNWRFPKFNGEGVPVVFPFVLSTGF